jgi:anti-sigma factor RsiW
MNCEWAKANVTLYVYDELPDDERYEFEQHTQRCPACAAELKAVRGLRAILAAKRFPSVSWSPRSIHRSMFRFR